MSKYIQYNDVCFKNRDALVAALKQVGLPNVEVGENMHLYGYHGDVRPEVADVIVRRKYIGHLSNDLGFTRTDKGYVPVISDYDRGRFNAKFVTDLQVAYQEHAIQSLATRLRGSIKREVGPGGQIKVKLRY